MFTCGPAFFTGASASDASLSAHRYWGVRINSTVTAGNWPNYGDMAFLSANGGNNVAAGKTLLTTGTFGSNQRFAFDALIGVATSTVDSQHHNVAHADATVPVIDYFDAGVGNAVTVRQFRLTALETAYLAAMPKDFDIVYSDNGTTWLTAWSVTNQTGWIQAEIRTFNHPAYAAPAYSGSKYGAHPYWRVALFGVTNIAINNVYSLCEIQMRATPGGANQCSGGTASAADTLSGFSAAAAFDGNATNLWASNNVKLSNWLKYAFPAPVSVGAITITARGDNNTSQNQTPIDFSIQFSDDNVNWNTAWHVLTPNWGLGETRVFTDPDYVA